MIKNPILGLFIAWYNDRLHAKYKISGVDNGHRFYGVMGGEKFNYETIHIPGFIWEKL